MRARARDMRRRPSPMSVPPELPNAISAVRVLMVPTWVIVAERQREALLAGEARPRVALLGILLAIGLSDLLDGWIARHFHLESHVGAVLDAIADKLAQVTIVTYLTFRAPPDLFAFPAGIWALLIARDSVIAIGWLTVKWRRGHVVSEHRWHGKAASLLLFATLVAIVAGLPEAPTWALLVSTSVVVLASTVDYFRVGVRQLSS